mmetsp:Transcript_1508/g.2339  ORF Transcript_1508/g.2339 Transcript_1508/m.2339 type:complete len:86 (+) Transcript_1508:389-646(+)
MTLSRCSIKKGGRYSSHTVDQRHGGSMEMMRKVGFATMLRVAKNSRLHFNILAPTVLAKTVIAGLTLSLKRTPAILYNYPEENTT